MSTDFFTAPGRFYRGNLHTHSNLSDGLLEPREVCRRYQAEGYDFLAVTDHFVGLYDYPVADTVPYRSEKFTTILGAELHTGKMDNGELWHILAVGLPADFTPPNAPDFRPIDGSESAADITQRAVDAGAFVAIAHPHWSGLSDADARSMTAAHAVEIYNHSCAIDGDRFDGLATLERLLNEGRKLTVIATDDAHFSAPDHFGGWVMVKAQENTPEALLAALKAGNSYATQGPEFHDIRVGKTAIEIDCTAVATISVQGSGIAAKRVQGESLTTGRIPLERFAKSPWVRVSIVDRSGKRAWSNPIWLDH